MDQILKCSRIAKSYWVSKAIFSVTNFFLSDYKNFLRGWNRLLPWFGIKHGKFARRLFHIWSVTVINVLIYNFTLKKKGKKPHWIHRINGRKNFYTQKRCPGVFRGLSFKTRKNQRECSSLRGLSEVEEHEKLVKARHITLAEGGMYGLLLCIHYYVLALLNDFFVYQIPFSVSWEEETSQKCRLKRAKTVFWNFTKSVIWY